MSATTIDPGEMFCYMKRVESYGKKDDEKFVGVKIAFVSQAKAKY